MRLLLVNPKSPESFWSFSWALDRVLSRKRALNPPLGLATVAALTPSGWDVEIVDENVESVPLDPQADVVGVCGMGVQFPRQKELLSYYRNRGYHVVAGGSYASLCPEVYEDLADTVVAGEAEYIWPEFCRDFESGTPRQLYRETGTVAMEDSPPPRYDLLDLSRYQTMSMQFSRGCPYRCEFCDIIVMFGRKPRTKPLDHVRAELDLLRRRGVRNVFFVDDNLIGDKRAAKQLLRMLQEYEREYGHGFRFGTEVSLNLAQDDELLGLLRSANFEWVFIGIESPDERSLKETGKLQNVRQDILSSVRHIYSYGIEVLGGFIVGFDNDTADTFERQYQFIRSSGIQAAMVGLLTAVPKTPLYERLVKEGRIIGGANDADNTRLGANIIPKHMRYDEMVSAYRKLQSRLLRPGNIALRIRNKLKHIRHPNRRRDYSLREEVKILLRLWGRGLLPGGPARWYHFVRSLPLLRPRLLPLALQDWIVGLSMRDYFNRSYAQAADLMGGLARRRIRKIEKVFGAYIRRGALEVRLHEVKDAAAVLSVSLKGFLDRRFFGRAGRHFRRLLRRTSVSMELHVDALQEPQRGEMERLLRHLSRYGSRIRVAVRQECRAMLEIDSSIFHVVLEG